MGLPFGYDILLVLSIAMTYAILSKETAEGFLIASLFSIFLVAADGVSGPFLMSASGATDLVAVLPSTAVLPSGDVVSSGSAGSGNW